jgi:hypothetical protein
MNTKKKPNKVKQRNLMMKVIPKRLALLDILHYRLDNFIRHTKRFFQFRYQRLVRGFADNEVWNLEYTIAKFALPRMKRLRKISKAYPCNLTPKAWDKIFDEIIYAFEQHLKDFGWLSHLSKKDQKRVQRGFKNFGIYFRDLWW